MPGAVPSAPRCVFRWSNPHFRDEETQPQSGRALCSRSPSLRCDQFVRVQNRTVKSLSSASPDDLVPLPGGTCRLLPSRSFPPRLLPLRAAEISDASRTPDATACPRGCGIQSGLSRAPDSPAAFSHRLDGDHISILFGVSQAVALAW